MKSPEYEHLFYFGRAVLASYRASPDLYSLAEDDTGGELTTLHNDEDGTSPSTTHPWFRVRFGLRRLMDGRGCVAAFGPDLIKLPDQERRIWLAHQIECPIFAESDPAFERFANRFLEGRIGSESGPLDRIFHSVKLIRALTHQILGKPLFRSQGHALLHYPAAENSEAYAKAHLELYRLLGDGLDSEALRFLAERLQILISNPSKTLNTLKELIPSALIPVIHNPLKKCSDARNKNHGISEKSISSFPAFDTFRNDLEKIATGLSELKNWLESNLSSNAEACLRREEAMYWTFPKFSGPPRPEEVKLPVLQQAEGKTIQSVEFGEVETLPEVHQSEAIILHFTDGSAMAIRVGSNAGNLSGKFQGLKPEDFSTDLMVSWAPSRDKES